MKTFSDITCPRCHRQFSGMRSSCPYCGCETEKEEARAVPPAASAVKGSSAARRADNALNLQMLVGGVLLLAIVISVICMASVSMSSRVTEADAVVEAEEEEVVEMAEATAVPTNTPEPTPSPTPEPTVTSVTITFLGNPTEGFMEQAGDEIQLSATWYPANIDATVEWSSDDESVATVSEDGLVTMIGSGSCTITAKVGNASQSITVWCS